MALNADGVADLRGAAPGRGFDSIFPCAPTSRDCLPQPGITTRTQYLDILSYRQRPTWRLAYRNFGTTRRWSPTSRSRRTRRRRRALVRDPADRTAPTPSTSRAPTHPATACTAGWAASPQDKQGNMALGYSVVNGVDVFPGIRYTGRLAGDPLGPDDARRGRRSSTARACRRPRTLAGATTPR